MFLKKRFKLLICLAVVTTLVSTLLYAQYGDAETINAVRKMQEAFGKTKSVGLSAKGKKCKKCKRLTKAQRNSKQHKSALLCLKTICGNYSSYPTFEKYEKELQAKSTTKVNDPALNEYIKALNSVTDLEGKHFRKKLAHLGKKVIDNKRLSRDDVTSINFQLMDLIYSQVKYKRKVAKDGKKITYSIMFPKDKVRLAFKGVPLYLMYQFEAIAKEHAKTPLVYYRNYDEVLKNKYPGLNLDQRIEKEKNALFAKLKKMGPYLKEATKLSKSYRHAKYVLAKRDQYKSSAHLSSKALAALSSLNMSVTAYAPLINPKRNRYLYKFKYKDMHSFIKDFVYGLPNKNKILKGKLTPEDKALLKSRAAEVKISKELEKKFKTADPKTYKLYTEIAEAKKSIDKYKKLYNKFKFNSTKAAEYRRKIESLKKIISSKTATINKSAAYKILQSSLSKIARHDDMIILHNHVNDTLRKSNLSIKAKCQTALAMHANNLLPKVEHDKVMTLINSVKDNIKKNFVKARFSELSAGNAYKTIDRTKINTPPTREDAIKKTRATLKKQTSLLASKLYQLKTTSNKDTKKGVSLVQELLQMKYKLKKRAKKNNFCKSKALDDSFNDKEPPTLVISQFNFKNKSHLKSILAHELAHVVHYFVSKIAVGKNANLISRESKKFYQKTKSCLVEKHHELYPKVKFTNVKQDHYFSEDWADLVSHDVNRKQQFNWACALHNKKYIREYGIKMTRLPDIDVHSPMIFRVLQKHVLRGKTIPQECRELTKGYNLKSCF